jgi:endonuclease I
MKKLFTFLLFTLSLTAFAQAPTGYYSSAEGKNTAALRTALQAIITNGAFNVGYGGLWTAYAKTDLNSSGKIWDMYSNCTFTYAAQQCGQYSVECDCYNREHSSPQSWFASAEPMVSDLFNVFPTDGKVNGERSNYVYGEVGTPMYTSGNGSKLGPSSFPDYAGTVFEPVDQYKGDLARSYFYMATRYAGQCESWSAGGEVMYSAAHLGLTTYAMDILLKWSRQDPVSAKEINRNNAAYGIQNNRNPFIDNPGLEEYIWGNKTNATFTVSGTVTPYLAVPSSGATVNFGNVPFQQTDTAYVFIKGINLTGDLTVALSGTNAANFSLPVASISQANATAGFKLVINFTAPAIGIQTAQLTISGGGITATPVTLNASSIDAFQALPASNITTSGFNANWTSSANATGYNLNIFSMTGNASGVPQTLLEEDFLSGFPTTWSKLGYSDTSTASNLRMGSSTQAGQITTPALNMSSATTLLVRAKEYGSDAASVLTVRVNADSVAGFLTTATNQDYTVNIPAKTATSKITLSVALGSGHRVYVDYVKVATQGVVLTPVLVNGYPMSVGNVLNYAVANLQRDSTYYYTVTPIGNTTPVSSQIMVRTLKWNTAVNELQDKTIIWTNNAEGIHFLNLPSDCNVSIVDMQGRQVQAFKHVSNELNLKLPGKGIYILQVFENAGSKVFIQKFNSMN